MGIACVATMLLVIPVTLLALPLVFLSCSVKSSLSTSGSVVSPNKSQPGSAGSRLGRATLADLLPAAEILEERLGSESDRSESQSLSPATEPQPSTDRSTGPEPELSESDSLEKHNRQNLGKIFYYSNLNCSDISNHWHLQPITNLYFKQQYSSLISDCL